MKKKSKTSRQVKTLQIFKETDLLEADASQIANFLEDFQKMIAGSDEQTQAISLRVPENVLRMFKLKAKSKGIKYQSQITQLMKDWLKN